MIVKIVVVIFLLGFLMVGSQLYEVDQEKGVERDIYNFTENTLKTPELNITKPPIENSKGIINVGRLYNIVDSGLVFATTTIFEVAKMGVEYGYQNPNINWKQIFKYSIYLIIIIIIVTLIKPIGYLFIFLVMLIMMLFNKSKKRKLKRLKGGTE